MTSIHDALHDLSARIPILDLKERLTAAAECGFGEMVFTSSLGMEDQVLTDAIVQSGLPIRITTLHTGRLFPETVDLIERTEAHFGVAIRDYKYDLADEADYVATYGLNGFYESREARRACCAFRKLKPLQQALAGAAVWITGLRRGQSDTRRATRFVEHDRVRDLIKLNPLADWDLDRVRAYVADQDVPINALHARGYPSIGCEPCTRAVRSGEPERAGRWWWESEQSRECGLHPALPAAGDDGSRPKGETHV